MTFLFCKKICVFGLCQVNLQHVTIHWGNINIAIALI